MKRMAIVSIRKSKGGIVTKICNKKKGFTLTELLSAILIMMLLTGILAVGVQVGVKAYVKSVSLSEAQTLCSTLTTLVSDELRYAGTITVEADGKVRFFSQNFGGSSEGGVTFETDADGHITLGGAQVLSSRAYPYGLNASVELSYAESTKIFTAEIKVLSGAGNELAASDFEVKPVNG